MKYFMNKRKQISFLLLLNIFYFFFSYQKSFSNPNKDANWNLKEKTINSQNKKIEWKKLIINEENQKKIKWEIISNSEYKKIFNNYEKLESEKKDVLINKEDLNFSENLSPIQISPTIQINNFPREGDLSQIFTLKSSFSGGDAKGTGNQNYSYRLDYSINNDTFFSGYISEKDDPYFKRIKNSDGLSQKNFWRNYSVVLNKKINQKRYKKLNLSLNATAELWYLDTLHKKGSSIGFFSGKEFIGSVGIPITYNFHNKLNLTAVPRLSFLPEKVGIGVNSQNYYGNSYSLGLGGDLKISETLYFLAGYSFQLGPGYNTFNENLDFSRNNIYNIGFQWNPNSRINLRALITNGFGETPSTGNLTIPGDNVPLYVFKLKLNSNYFDTPTRLLNKREYSLIHKGLTIDTGLVPEYGTNQLWLDFNSKGSLFAYYGYSFSNIFQIEILNLGYFNNETLNSSGKYKTLTSTFAGEQNLNNRFGGKLLLLSPTKGNPFWLSSRITLGRDQKSNQGYYFFELPTTFELNPKLALNISPKYLWSGYGNLAGLGLGINYKINKKLQLIPEMIAALVLVRLHS